VLCILQDAVGRSKQACAGELGTIIVEELCCLLCSSEAMLISMFQQGLLLLLAHSRVHVGLVLDHAQHTSDPVCCLLWQLRPGIFLHVRFVAVASVISNMLQLLAALPLRVLGPVATAQLLLGQGLVLLLCWRAIPAVSWELSLKTAR
jgi:hypothetical protein